MLAASLSIPSVALLSGGGGSAAGPQAAAFLARTSGLDATHTNAYTALINGLVADGVWSKLDALWIYATQDSATALLNLVSASYPCVRNGSPAFVADSHFSGGTDGGSTVFLDTGFNPRSASSPKATQNSMHLSAWSTVANSANGSIIGAIDSGSTEFAAIKPRDLSGNFNGWINNATQVAVAVAAGDGFFGVDRSASNTVTGYKTGSSIVTSSSNNSIGTVNANIYVLALNNIGTSSGSTYQCSAASIGSSLSGTDWTNFYNRLRTYMTAVGVP